MTGKTTYLSILTLNINGFNSPIKDYLVNRIKKEDPEICCLGDPSHRQKQALT
jgi:exonuclease III